MNKFLGSVKDINMIAKVILIFKTYPLVIMVLLKDVSLPHLRWKKGPITEVIKGNNGLGRGVPLDTFISTTDKTRCSNGLLQNIVPLEFKETEKSDKNVEFLDNKNSEYPKDEDRPRRVSAANGDILRRLR